MTRESMASAFPPALTLGPFARAAGRVALPGSKSISNRTLLLAALPAYIVMRIGAEWMYSKEFDSNSDDPTWIGIGYITADIGALLLLIALITAGIASWKSKNRLGKASGIVAAIALAGWIVAVWAMSGKP